MNYAPPILVIIVTWNKKQYVLDLLDSLAGIDYPRTQMDVLVVDNASTDGTVEAVGRHPLKVRLLANKENLGGCGGFNTGLAWAFSRPEKRYRYLWLLDNDVQVNRHALADLVALLEQDDSWAVAGSTMMQLTRPGRINEMGAMVDRKQGLLLLRYHGVEVDEFSGMSLADLRGRKIHLDEHLANCPSSHPVDYVAAASLLVRTDVARRAGLWDDFFLHFDDVEWCLRIAAMGYSVVVSARSLIWHVPGEHKVPTWVLYYDNRNVLYLLEKHSTRRAVRRTMRHILLKSLYYVLLGKQDLALLLVEAVRDFRRRRMGKKRILLDDCYHGADHLAVLFRQDDIRRILIVWTEEMKACGVAQEVESAMQARSDLEFSWLVPQDAVQVNLPGFVSVREALASPSSRLWRYLWYLRMFRCHDLVLQSDYHLNLPLVWLGKKTLYMNYEGGSLRRPPGLRAFGRYLKQVAGLVWTG